MSKSVGVIDSAANGVQTASEAGMVSTTQQLDFGFGLGKLTSSVFVQDNPSGVCLGRNQAEIPFERCDREDVPC